MRTKAATLIDQVMVGDLIFTIRYEIPGEPYTIDFAVYGPSVSADYTETGHIDDPADSFFEGGINWDGCTNIGGQTMLHLYSHRDLTRFQRLVAHVSMRAHQLMGLRSDFEFGPDWNLLPPR